MVPKADRAGSSRPEHPPAGGRAPAAGGRLGLLSRPRACIHAAATHNNAYTVFVHLSGRGRGARSGEEGWEEATGVAVGG